MNDHAPHILVVDDDDRLRDLLRQYLSGNGYRVTAAGDAAEARARLRSMAFDLIVLDVMMPGEDGLALTASLKQVSETPILLLTARNEPEDRIDGLERGADDYLAKPFEPRELVLRIANLLRRAPRTAAAPVLRFGEHLFDIERTELTRNELAVHEGGAVGVVDARGDVQCRLRHGSVRPVTNREARDYPLVRAVYNAASSGRHAGDSVSP